VNSGSTLTAGSHREAMPIYGLAERADRGRVYFAFGVHHGRRFRRGDSWRGLRRSRHPRRVSSLYRVRPFREQLLLSDFDTMLLEEAGDPGRDLLLRTAALIDQVDAIDSYRVGDRPNYCSASILTNIRGFSAGSKRETHSDLNLPRIVRRPRNVAESRKRYRSGRARCHYQRRAGIRE